MLNLLRIFDEATGAIQNHSKHLKITPLPAAVYMMQVDVINHYRHALDHYFTLTLNEPYLQNSSLGTPYQKWASFTNANFRMLSFTIHNLLRYTSRLIHETECPGLLAAQRFAEHTAKSNSYTMPIIEMSHRGKLVGIQVLDDFRLSVVPIKIEPLDSRVGLRSSKGGSTTYFRIRTDGQEEEIGLEEYQRLTEIMRPEFHDIHDRSKLTELHKLGHAEIGGLIKVNRRFSDLCNTYYGEKPVAESFSALNQSYWI